MEKSDQDKRTTVVDLTQKGLYASRGNFECRLESPNVKKLSTSSMVFGGTGASVGNP